MTIIPHNLQEVKLKIYNQKNCNNRWNEANKKLNKDQGWDRSLPIDVITDGHMCTLSKAGEGLCWVC